MSLVRIYLLSSRPDRMVNGLSQVQTSPPPKFDCMESPRRASPPSSPPKQKCRTDIRRLYEISLSMLPNLFHPNAWRNHLEISPEEHHVYFDASEWLGWSTAMWYETRCYPRRPHQREQSRSVADHLRYGGRSKSSFLPSERVVGRRFGCEPRCLSFTTSGDSNRF